MKFQKINNFTPPEKYTKPLSWADICRLPNPIFKPGDKVRAIHTTDASALTQNRIYTIKSCQKDMDSIFCTLLELPNTGLLSQRFEKVEG